jgi:sulfite reductase beta subunit-like hemoprotein
MNYNPQQLRLDGIYQQTGDDLWMQRIKVPAGALASEQALKIADLAEQFAGHRAHLTTRGSIELHDLHSPALAEVNRGLASVGLTGRGACGGAVRGISCSTSFSPHFQICQSLARKLQRHFVGNPSFEGLPKKFKIGVDGDRETGRQLIQDAGLVFAGKKDDQPLWDVWCAGGLGREPRPGILLGERIPEARLIPLIEGLIRIYRDGVERGKRLKHLLNAIGEDEFRSRLRAATPTPPAPTPTSGLGETLSLKSAVEPLTVRVFAGELSAAGLRRLAHLAKDYADGSLLITADQDLAFLPGDASRRSALQRHLAGLGLDEQTTAPQPCFRICPGNHECRMGLSATRDVARQVLTLLPTSSAGQSFAIAGCPNSCSQPQLADFGIITRTLVKDADGRRTPRFELLGGEKTGFGTPIATELGLQELLDTIKEKVNNSK